MKLQPVWRTNSINAEYDIAAFTMLMFQINSSGMRENSIRNDGSRIMVPLNCEGYYLLKALKYLGIIGGMLKMTTKEWLLTWEIECKVLRTASAVIKYLLELRTIHFFVFPQLDVSCFGWSCSS